MTTAPYMDGAWIHCTHSSFQYKVKERDLRNVSVNLQKMKTKSTFCWFCMWLTSSRTPSTPISSFQRRADTVLLISPQFNAPILVNLHSVVSKIQEAFLSGESPNEQSENFYVSYFLGQFIFNYFKITRVPDRGVPIANHTTPAS